MGEIKGCVGCRVVGRTEIGLGKQRYGPMEAIYGPIRSETHESARNLRYFAKFGVVSRMMMFSISINMSMRACQTIGTGTTMCESHMHFKYASSSYYKQSHPFTSPVVPGPMMPIGIT